MMLGLIAFLNARLDEDEEMARSARDLSQAATRGAYAMVMAAGDVAHVARHHPARVLRDVEAKRWILREHNVPSVATPGFGTREDDRRCVGCGFGNDEEPRTPDVEGCPVLRALASVYADHPEYRQEWAP